MDPFLLSDVAFHACLHEAAKNAELVKEFDRLSGTNLSMRGKPIDLAIDAASGRQEAEAGRFAEFVADFIFARLQPSVLDAMRRAGT